jgi:ABC-2 type transport system permease protein
MTTTLAHAGHMTVRRLRVLWRQPWYVAITLMQPVIWLLLFGALFERVVEIPGFGGGDYVDFLTPGIVIMTALFSAGWTGMGVIDDLDRGVMDRFLVSPVRRVSLIAGPLGQLATVIVIQSLIIVGLGAVTGAGIDGGVAGIAALIGCAVLLAWAIGGLSIALALVARKEETLIGAVQFVVLPLTFPSTGASSRHGPASWPRSQRPAPGSPRGCSAPTSGRSSYRSMRARKSGSSRSDAKSSSFRAHSFAFGSSSTDRRRWAIASSRRPVSAS